uniref:Uncharacterized protein n=1 Tax=Rhizophora mucronata TaxID=61149 RepID=A0A2P2PGF4_RHIMU
MTHIRNPPNIHTETCITEKQDLKRKKREKIICTYQ